MKQNPKRTIQDVLDLETGQHVDANTFFLKPLDEVHYYRSRLERAIQGLEPELFVCYYCKQMIKIRGGGTSTDGKRKIETLHFAHLKDSDDCHIKTQNNLSKDVINRIRYNGVKEGQLHIMLKERLAECLLRNEKSKEHISKIEVEKVIKDAAISRDWRKPDINAFYRDKRVAFELQLSTTYLSVITERQHFYEENEIYIFWIFNQFDGNDYTRKLTINDVIYTNNQNAFVFDEETYKLSQERNDLILRCYYKYYSLNAADVLIEEWREEFIDLSKIKFEPQHKRVFYFDSNRQKEHFNQQIFRSKNLQRKIELVKYEISLQDEEIIRVQNRLLDANNELLRAQSKVDQLEKELPDFIKYVTGEVLYTSHTYDTLLSERKHTLSKEILKIRASLFEYQEKLDRVKKRIDSIDSLKVIEVNGEKYHQIQGSMIKSAFEKFRIKAIHQDSLSNLFATHALIEIDNLHQININEHTKGMLFLLDLKDTREAYQTEAEKIKEEIKETQAKEVFIKKEIKEMLENFHQNKCNLVRRKSEDLKNRLDTEKEKLEKQNIQLGDLVKELREYRKSKT